MNSVHCHEQITLDFFYKTVNAYLCFTIRMYKYKQLALSLNSNNEKHIRKNVCEIWSLRPHFGSFVPESWTYMTADADIIVCFSVHGLSRIAEKSFTTKFYSST